jgi:hypothetical protein
MKTVTRNEVDIHDVFGLAKKNLENHGTNAAIYSKRLIYFRSRGLKNFI